jgi:hypothetical protein
MTEEREGGRAQTHPSEGVRKGTEGDRRGGKEGWRERAERGRREGGRREGGSEGWREGGTVAYRIVRRDGAFLEVVQAAHG